MSDYYDGQTEGRNRKVLKINKGLILGCIIVALLIAIRIIKAWI